MRAVCYDCLTDIAIYTLSSTLVNLPCSINTTYLHLNLFCFFYLAWFELPSGLLHFALSTERLRKLLCEGTPSQCFQPARASQAPAAGEFGFVKWLCQTHDRVLVTSALPSAELRCMAGGWDDSPGSCSVVKPRATSLWCLGNFASSFSQHLQVLLNLNNHNPGLLLQKHQGKTMVPKALVK